MDVKYKIDSLMIFDSIKLEEEPGAPAQAVEWAEGALSLLPSFDLEFSLPQKRWAPTRRETGPITIPACVRRSALCYHLHWSYFLRPCGRSRYTAVRSLLSVRSSCLIVPSS